LKPVETSEKRILGFLLLVAGVSFLSVALYTGQLAKVVELIGGIFEPAVAGLP
jgi:hypothetical protein